MENKCLHCLYIWESRIENPKACPKCKRYIVAQEKKEEKISDGNTGTTNTDETETRTQ